MAEKGASKRDSILKKREPLWLALGSIAFALCFGYPIVLQLTHGAASQWPLNDWDLNMEMLWVPFYTVSHFAQFPLWDPYKCGGIPLLANPQSIYLTPLFVLHLLFGPDTGVHLEVLAHIALGFAGAYFLARVLRLRPLAAIASGGTYAGSSWYYGHLAVGHCVMMAHAYVPWVVAFFYICAKRCRPLPGLCAGFLMALIFMEGGVYALPQTALVLVLLGVLLVLKQGNVAPIGALAIVGLSTVGFAAIKLLPLVAFVGIEPRPIGSPETNYLSDFLAELLFRNQDPAMVRAGQVWGFYEYEAYVGYFYATLALIGVIRRLRQSLPWLILSLILLSLAAGNLGAYSPWVLIHRLPLFADLRLPTRILILFTLTLGILASIGVDAMAAPIVGWLPTITPILVGVALIDSWVVNAPYLAYAVIGQEKPIASSPDFRQMSSSELYGHMYTAAKANIGVLGCNEVLGRTANPTGSDQSGYKGEQYVLGSGRVQLTDWTPNKLDMTSRCPNQRY